MKITKKSLTLATALSWSIFGWNLVGFNYSRKQDNVEKPKITEEVLKVDEKKKLLRIMKKKIIMIPYIVILQNLRVKEIVFMTRDRMIQEFLKEQ
jgi:hypothetical protein